ncbi:MAG: glycoside hydrolase family 43 protein [Bacteroidota bacterium]|nr:glycoside hydrolase family 43 protein [Bacteroidota bacterium]
MAMKRITWLLILTTFFLNLNAQNVKSSRKVTTSGNPVFPGWYADPEGTVFGNEYWIYPTYSDAYEKQTFFDAFSSKNLVKWEKHPHVLDIKDVKWATRAVWAPAIIRANGKYYLFFGANDIQNDNQLGGIGVAVSNKPGGPFKDALGKPLIDKFHNGAQPIDQFVFKDKDGSYYMYYGGWRHCNVVKLSKDLLSIVPFPDGSTFKEITPDSYVEGPFMFYRNGKYYFMWSEGGWTGPDYCVAYAISDSPFGPFKRIGKILQQDSKVATGAGHHSVIKVPRANEWYIVYHRRPLGETDGNHRVTCIDRMYFDKDGFIKPVNITFEGVAARPLK